jgi:hypothetical protein
MLIEKKNHANKVPEGRHLNHYGRFLSVEWLSCSLDVQMELYAKNEFWWDQLICRPAGA